MNIKIYTVGNKIEKYYLEAMKEYEKRLNRYCKIQIEHFKDWKLLLNKLPEKSYKISVSLTGTILSSEELAEKIHHYGLYGTSDISIIIGTENIPCNEEIAISPMEMSLGLKTTIILEQIYRAYRILNNQAYHK